MAIINPEWVTKEVGSFQTAEEMNTLATAVKNNAVELQTDITNLSTHINNKSNPHEVTKVQLDLDNVDNVSDINKPVSIAQAEAIAVVQTNLNNHKADVNNPHGVTKVQIGLSEVNNTSDINKPVSTATQNALDTKENILNKGIAGGYAALDEYGKIPEDQLPSSSNGVSTAQSSAINSVQTDLNAHKGKTNNPHSVTKSQVGLGNVDNTSDIDKPVSTAQQTSISGVQTNLDTHENNTSNPHSVTKSQVGLPNVDNTSDINKPISTATQTALDLKANKNVNMIAGNGMIGGGTLEADRTYNVASANDGITVNADNIQLNTIDNLTTTSITKPLSANQGKILNDNAIQLEADLSKSVGKIPSDNIVSFLNNGYYNPSTKMFETTESTDWKHTDFIPVSLLTDSFLINAYNYQTNQVAAIAFFSTNNVNSMLDYISGNEYITSAIRKTSRFITKSNLPAGTNYIILSTHHSYLSDSYVKNLSDTSLSIKSITDNIDNIEQNVDICSSIINDSLSKVEQTNITSDTFSNYGLAATPFLTNMWVQNANKVNIDSYLSKLHIKGGNIGNDKPYTIYAINPIALTYRIVGTFTLSITGEQTISLIDKLYKVYTEEYITVDNLPYITGVSGLAKKYIVGANNIVTLYGADTVSFPIEIELKTIKDTVNIEEVTTEINKKFNINEIQSGCSIDTFYPFLSSSFANYYATIKTPATNSGILKTFTYKSKSAGKVKLYVGFLDQLNLAILGESFEVDVLEGLHTYDISNLSIPIKIGEYLFIYMTSPAMPYYTTAGDPNLWYSTTANSKTLRLHSASGGQMTFAWSIEYSDSNVFVPTPIFNAVKDTAEQALNISNSVSSSLNVVSDYNGNKYKLKIVNGNLTTIPMQFKDVICVGNSITCHPIVDGTWWSNRAMASTRENMAWTYHLQTVLQVKEPTSKVRAIFGRNWEQGLYPLSNENAIGYWDEGTYKKLLPNISSFSTVDCIVFKIGENATADSSYESKFKELVNWFINLFPTAYILIVSESWPNTIKDTAMSNVAASMGIPFALAVNNGYDSVHINGQYVADSGTVLHQITNGSVAAHPNDYGMLLLANIISNALGYSQLSDYVFNISKTINNGTLEVQSVGVKGGIISVKITPDTGYIISSVTITDANSNVITSVDQGNTSLGRFFTFTMPNSNVSINVITVAE